VAVAFWALHFLHLAADFPNNSPWSDWSKYTDEGWYGDAAIRHFILGHWYLAGDFNPGVVMPVWPLLEAAVFRCTGVSLVAARALTVVAFGITGAGLYALIRQADDSGDGKAPLSAAIACLLLATSPFLYVFNRLAILEPSLCAIMVLALLAANSLRPAPLRAAGARNTALAVLRAGLFGVLLATLVLTKPTAFALLPAFLPLLWARAGHRPGTLLALAIPPALIALAAGSAFYLLAVSPRYLEDFQYLFTANAYTGFQLEPLARVLFNTVADGSWMGAPLYAGFFVILALLAFLRPPFFRRPLVQSFLVWILGYLAFLGYHNNLQPRYYLLLAVPVTALTAMGLVELSRIPSRPGLRHLMNALVTLTLAAILLPDARMEFDFLRHPEYSFEAAAQSIARIVRADKTRSPLILSVSGSELTLMTGLPSIDDDFGTLDLDERVRRYRPGWYVAWNEIDDDKMDALQPLYKPVRVAAFPALDDPDRNLLILYRLDPASAPAAPRRLHRRIPRPLRTRLGQQPTAVQLQH
jgi:hypothetical protein